MSLNEQTPRLNAISDVFGLTAADMLQHPVDYSERLDFESLEFQSTVATAREWFGGIYDPNLTPEQREEELEQCVRAITNVSDYGPLQPGEGVSEQQVRRSLRWLVQDIGRMTLVVREPTIGNIGQYEFGAKTAHHVVTRTLDHAYEEHEQRRLRNVSVTDPLTGVLNRRGYSDALDYVLFRAKESGGGVARTLLDLTDFKKLNDKLGYTVGDGALCEVDDEVKRHARQGDWFKIGRLGGDEFEILHNNIPQTGYNSFSRRMQDSQIAKVSAVDGQPSRYAAAWTKIADCEARYAARGQVAKEHTRIQFEERYVERYEREPIFMPVRVLYIGEERIAPLQDIVVLSVGGVYGKGSKLLDNAEQAGKDIESNMVKHKKRLHRLMGRYVRQKVEDTSTETDHAAGRVDVPVLVVDGIASVRPYVAQRNREQALDDAKAMSLPEAGQ